MAKRWFCGMLIGTWAACGWPAAVTAQAPADPVPVARGVVRAGGQPVWPGLENGQTTLAYPSQAAYYPPMPGPGGSTPPLAGYGGPGMGGGAIPGGGYASPFMNQGGAPMPPIGGGFSGPSQDSGDAYWEGSERARIWVNFGWLTLKRQNLKNHALAQLDEFGFDAGFPPSNSRPIIQTFGHTDIEYNDGFKVGLGLFLEEGAMIEVSGFYLPNQGEDPRRLRRPGEITSYFFNPPVGFEGTNAALWSNADIMTQTFRSTLGSGEINWRFVGGGEGVEAYFLTGLRYIDQYERYDLYTSDDNIQIGFNPLTSANLMVKTHNHMLGWQFGCGVQLNPVPFFGIGWDARAAAMANYIDFQQALIRSDGLTGFDIGDQKWQMSHVYETGAYLALNGSFWRLKGGYQFLWLVNTAKAENQIDFNLEAMPFRRDSNGTTFFHGPSASLDIVF
jgi:hypothetical protein